MTHFEGFFECDQCYFVGPDNCFNNEWLCIKCRPKGSNKMKETETYECEGCLIMLPWDSLNNEWYCSWCCLNGKSRWDDTQYIVIAKEQ